MPSGNPWSNNPALGAMICSALVGAQFVAGKATRDALFLANLDVTALPAMVMVTAAVSIGFVALSSRALRRMTPGAFVSAAFAMSAALLAGEWLLVGAAPVLAAQAVYLQISGLGPILGSGFWLLATERFDPRTARRRFGQIAGAGTLGGLAGALVAERMAAIVDVPTMLPVLAVLNLACAWQVRGMGGTIEERVESANAPAELVADSPRSGLRVLAETPYLRNLAALVLLGTLGATLADYVFKLHAVEALGRGEALLRFFAAYYAATNLLTFLIQTTSTTRTLERLGLAAATSTPSLALLAGGAVAMLSPGLASITAARGGESILRGSLFRTGYEIFYTPVPAGEKRAAKSLIDVGFDRLGDLLGGAAVRLLILLPAAQQTPVVLAAALACSGAALVVARRLNRGYVDTLERSLVNRAIELELHDAQDLTTRTVMVRTLHAAPAASGAAHHAAAPATTPGFAVTDPELQQIAALRSRNRDRILSVLTDAAPLAPTLVPHVIPLLAWDVVADAAVEALRKVADAHVGGLTDVLLDPHQPFAVRRRLARVFSVCRSERAAAGLLLALDDQRFEVRFQCGRSLAAIVERNPQIRVDPDRIFDVVRREALVGRPVWESNRLLDRLDEGERSFVDEFVKDRAGQSLAHVFSLLSLVLPRLPLQIAFRGLHTDDPALRGTALEYLEGVLPAGIRTLLWPFLGEAPERASDPRPRQEILDDLLRSNESIQLNLDELRRREINVTMGS